MKKTRKQKAEELMRLVKNGPSLHSFYGKYTPEEAMGSTKLWLSSWVEPLVRELVPELRERGER